MKKLTRAEATQIRDRLCIKQGWKCPLCGKSLKVYDPVLDHCHDTGRIRGVLCRNCNGMEGKVRTASIRAAKTEGAVGWVTKLGQYLQHFKDNPQPFIYPSHKTADEKRLLANKRARERRATAKKAAK